MNMTNMRSKLLSLSCNTLLFSAFEMFQLKSNLSPPPSPKKDMIKNKILGLVW